MVLDTCQVSYEVISDLVLWQSLCMLFDILYLNGYDGDCECKWMALFVSEECNFFSSLVEFYLNIFMQ